MAGIVVTNQKSRVTQFEEIAGLKILSQESQLPGIGFFNNANVSVQQYAGVTIEVLSGDVIEIKWAPIVDASQYRMKLQRFVNGGIETVSQLETGQTEARFKIEEPIANVRFEWTLSGVKSDKSVFLSRGGFVID